MGGGGALLYYGYCESPGAQYSQSAGGGGSNTHAYTVAPLAVVGAGRQGRWGEGRAGGGGE